MRCPSVPSPVPSLIRIASCLCPRILLLPTPFASPLSLPCGSWETADPRRRRPTPAARVFSGPFVREADTSMLQLKI